MKKTRFILMTALSVAALASCQKEELIQSPANLGEKHEITLTLASDTKTALQSGKTVWSSGDQILLTNGTLKDTLTVQAAEAGGATVTMQTTLTGELVAVYPVKAAAATVVTADGDINVKIPADQSGQFADANISVAKSTDYNLKMSNVAAIMKVSTPNDGLYVVLNASGDALSGNIKVTFAEDGTFTTTASGTTGIITCEAPTADDYYIAVAPGTYKAGFSIMAVDAATGGFQTKATTVENKLEINQIVDLGEIGGTLSGFTGEGSEADPYKVTSVGELLALANAVSVGNTFEGKYFKVQNDIEGALTLPIGYCDADDFYFKGNFDGDNHKINIDMDGASCRANRNVALFGDVSAPAVIKNIDVYGTVKASGNYVAGVVAMVNAGAGVTISNVKSHVEVTGNGYVGGIIGYADASAADGLVVDGCANLGTVVGKGNYVGGICGYTATAVNKQFKNCTNSGNVTGGGATGGIIGYGYYSIISNSKNSGTIASTAGSTGVYGLYNGSFSSPSGYNTGVGGIVGWDQNGGTILACENTGDVSGATKVGGIAGVIYWTAAKDCTNSGNITGTGTTTRGIVFGSVTGGIVGWDFCRLDITNCNNSGTITGKGGTGGIAGVVQSTTSAVVKVNNCHNTGEVISTGEATGGIVGIAWSQGANKSTTVTNCTNKAKVSANSNSVGGICGKTYDANNSGTGLVELCLNEGAVSGTYYVGGVVGFGQSRATKGITTMRNCGNTGSVTSTRTDAQPAYAGGLVGNTTKTGVDNTGFFIYNCYNTGDVKAVNSEYGQPNIGGIVGKQAWGGIANVYNGGAVGFVDGTTPSEDQAKYIGALAADFVGTLKSAYYLENTAANAIGTACTTAYNPVDDNIIAADETGALVSNAFIADNNYSSVVDALNAWIAAQTTASTYSQWAEGPVFVQ